MTDRAWQKLIFAGCRELGIDDDTRRELQFALTGKASLSAMTELEMRAVVDGLKARGFNPEASSRARGGHKAASRPDLRYIHVLWGLLGKQGVLKAPGRRGLNAFVRDSFTGKWGAVPMDIDTLTDAAQIRDVTEALKAWCRRVGVKVTR